MAATPTPEQEAIINAERIAVLATVRRNGGPQVAPINYVFQDGRFLISTTRQRVKYANVKRNPAVSICIVREGGHPYLTCYGTAAVEEENVAEGTAAIARSMGREPPDNFADILRDQQRILIIVTPERFVP